MRQRIEAFLVSRDFSPDTVRSYRWMLEQLADWLAENRVPVELLDGTYVELFFESRPEWGHNARYLCYCAARSYCRWRFGARHALLGYHLGRVKTDPQRSLSKRSSLMVAAACDTTTAVGKRDLGMILLMLDTGMRAIEIARAELSRLDLDERELLVQVKGGAWQRKTFTRYTAALLAEWLEASRGVRRCDRVFVSLSWKRKFRGQALTPAGVREVIYGVAERAGIRCSPHDFRRTFAILASKHRAPRQFIMAQAGWSNMQMLDHYTRGMMLDADEWEAASPVNWIMGIDPEER